MIDTAHAPNRFPWPPIIFILAAAAGMVLHWLVPLPFLPDGPARFVAAAMGLCGLCAGVALEIVTVLTFRRHRTTILPHRGATALITDGPFAKSRNPIYTGNTLLIISAGLLFGIWWLVVAAPIAAAAVRKLAIEREETHLAARFGPAWTDYAARTPRWLFFR
ncbi:MAG: isoprenylcysteine carboxylmethyltransferase family protein [Alphaproteobacteria bacterium]|nr:isoprenylcysteine carboxylmethyltransferase family protein [Alphaproteobacteria bacterium]